MTTAITECFLFLSLDFLHSHQGDKAKHGTADKRNPVINHPKGPAYGRQNHCCNVVHGETYGYACCDVFGVSDFLEIGLDGDVKIVKNLVQEVKNHNQPFGLSGCICQKNKYQAEIFY